MNEVTMAACRDCAQGFEASTLASCGTCRVLLCASCKPAHTCTQEDINHWNDLVARYPQFYGPLHPDTGE